LSRQHLQRNLLLFCCLWSNSLFFSSSSNFSRPRHGSIWFFLFCTLFNRQFCLNCPYWYTLLQKKKSWLSWGFGKGIDVEEEKKRNEKQTKETKKEKKAHVERWNLFFF
jgi:hypothetical protein